jgi:hypothetical protein
MVIEHKLFQPLIQNMGVEFRSWPRPQPKASGSIAGQRRPQEAEMGGKGVAQCAALRACPHHHWPDLDQVKKLPRQVAICAARRAILSVVSRL